MRRIVCVFLRDWSLALFLVFVSCHCKSFWAGIHKRDQAQVEPKKQLKFTAFYNNNNNNSLF